jgi:RNA polymerase sigma-70 factor (ECF subfamily)
MVIVIFGLFGLGAWRRRATAGPEADLAAARIGDRLAVDRFYEAHVDGLYAFVFSRVGRNETLADDVVQETLMKALEPAVAATYDTARGTVGSWLSILSRNVIRDHLRAHKKSDELAATWERIDATLAQTFAALAETPLPNDVIARAETRDLVQMAVANLPEQYRRALTRKYVDGDSLEQLAGDLGISIDATKSLLARARRAFRDTFEALNVHFSEVV